MHHWLLSNKFFLTEFSPKFLYPVWLILAGSYFQCSRIVTTQESPTYRCCLVTDSEIQYRKPGDMILYSKYATPVKCQTGWEGRNCDACVLTSWTMWHMPDRLGRTVTYAIWDSTQQPTAKNASRVESGTETQGITMIVYLTFDGPICSDLLPGRFLDFQISVKFIRQRVFLKFSKIVD